MRDITLIILTKNEELNIRNCIISAKQIADRSEGHENQFD